VNFLVDNQLPDDLSRFLTDRGHRSNHVLDLGMDEASDLQIWDYATKGNWIVVSKDGDFLHLANRPGDFGKLLWVRIGNCRKQTLLQLFENELPDIVHAFDEGVRVVEIR
jgi:predicted nuclease of predicted toxin-antitoxin system